MLGTARIATNQGASPSKFVWLTDHYVSFIHNISNPQYRFVNPYGDVNASVMLFLDGHVGYNKIVPGTGTQRFTTNYYTFIFE